jgi:hypothetical protein
MSTTETSDADEGEYTEESNNTNGFFGGNIFQ